MKIYSIELRCIVEKCDINYLREIIESYDNLAVITTIDSVVGLVAFFVAPGNEKMVIKVLKDLSKKILLKFVYGPFLSFNSILNLSK